MKYTICRYHNDQLITKLANLSEEVAKGIVEIVWSSVPEGMKVGGEIGEELKFSLGEGHWIVVVRTA
jgi:hypothetical protein